MMLTVGKLRGYTGALLSAQIFCEVKAAPFKIKFINLKKQKTKLTYTPLSISFHETLKIRTIFFCIFFPESRDGIECSLISAYPNNI